ncbi:unconventional myosin-XVIIIa isoform X4 [Ischnura elegans]|uniref:unconventional myosin-XVIIIa isoform X4 n=1 Tax=Ischnura elegans TaxID=197161 RepID=UPI001ED8B20B|nr:unconventional myosin-XVIIIa isoform X4 [Ischnura elegans]
MFNFMKKDRGEGGLEKEKDREEKERKKREKKERKENKKRESRSEGRMTAEELLRLDEVRRSLKLRPGVVVGRRRRRDKEKLPSGITADYSATFFADLDRAPGSPTHLAGTVGPSVTTSLDPSSPSPSSSSASWFRETLTQSDSSEASLTSPPHHQAHNTPHHAPALLPPGSRPPLPPRPPKRGILKQVRGSIGLVDSEEILPLSPSNNSLRGGQNQLVQPTANNHQASRRSKSPGEDEEEDLLQVRTSENHLSPADSTSRASDDFPSAGSGDYLTPPKMVTSPSGEESLTEDEDALRRGGRSLGGASSPFATPPFSMSPAGEAGGWLGGRWGEEGPLPGANLPLPAVASAPLPRPRVLTVRRQQPRGDFGFSLRRAVVVERCGSGAAVEKGAGDAEGVMGSGWLRRRAVLFAEPGSMNRGSNETGLLPGDRLLEVNGIAVDDKGRDEIIDLIKSSGDTVTVKVQAVSELSELTRRWAADGSEVELDEDHIRGGTLRRSGGGHHRLKASTMARSEEQCERERAWLEAERAWLVHRAGFTAVRRLSSSSSVCGGSDGGSTSGGDVPEGKVRVLVEATGEQLLVDEEDVEKANPPQQDMVEDIASLRHLNEASVLHALRSRYAADLVHTHAAAPIATLIINPCAPLAIYSEKVAQMFRGCKLEDMPPHIYAVAQGALRGMISTRSDHSVVLTGRSGSGKTTNFRHILHYLVLTAGSVNKVLSVEKLNAISILLESFGNCRTSMNSNASRFTEIFSLDFDQSGQIASASVQVLLPEKTRVVRRPEGELTFHAFYRLLAGAEGMLRRELQLDGQAGADNYQMLNQRNIFITPMTKHSDAMHEDRQRAALDFGRVCTAMSLLNFTESEAKVIWSVLAAIYHLGTAGAAKAGNGASGRWQFANPQAAQRAARLLGTSVEELVRNVLNGGGVGAGGAGTPLLPRSASSSFRTPSPIENHTSTGMSGVEALEGAVVGMYGEVLNAVVALINRSICTTVHTVSSLLVVDTPGFQNPTSCAKQGGATFHDLCHNYLQERLQLLFHQTALVAPRDRYMQEHIDVAYDDEEMDMEDEGVPKGDGSKGKSGDGCSLWQSPAPLVALLDKPPPGHSLRMIRSSQADLRESERHTGLLWLLDEEAVLYQATSDDNSFLHRLFENHSDREHQVLLRKGPGGGDQFVLNHLQGTNPVLYSTTGWLKASRENPLTRVAASLLQDSARDEVSRLFASVRSGPVSSVALGGTTVGIEGSQSLRRASSIRRTLDSGTAGIKRKSLCLQVKFQVDGLIETLRRTRLKFVHCFLPQHDAGLCEVKATIGNGDINNIPLNVPLLRSQLRGFQTVAAARLYKQGFPDHLLFSEFRRRFSLLAPSTVQSGSDISSDPGIGNSLPSEDEQAVITDMLQAMDLDPSSYRLGMSQVFFRAGVLPHLEAQRDERLQDRVVRLQARCRGYLARKHLAKLKVQDMAVRCIQRNVRRFLSVRDWPWWRLLVRVSPLLNVHRTEEQLRARTEELEAMRQRLERLEAERAGLKRDKDKLEAKLTEMTADLAEEHSTSTLAAERLEAEAAERIRLEKELQESQGRNKVLQQSSERLEMELLFSRAAGMNGDVGGGGRGMGDDDEDVDDCDSGAALIYKQRYERAARELEFAKRRLQQQHEDDLEQLVGLKKQLEKKLTDAYEEVEEQRQVVGQWKRKSQKLTGEVNDLRLLLEEQNSRNVLLEKKQRKFDSELQQLQRELQQEKQNRERTAREKEAAQAELYTLEQSMSAMKLELELKDEKLTALTRELDELTFGGKTEEEVANLKKAKHELELKVKDQEEELDDLAGQVQLLEQAKLRLEMSLEQQRKEARREAAQRDEELEEARCNAHKKVKALEAQLEAEHEERTRLLRERHELERRLVEEGRGADGRRGGGADAEETIQRLRRDLRRTKALLRDAHTLLERSKSEPTAGKALLRSLRNQLEDAEAARQIAQKARQSAEEEAREAAAALEEALRQRSEAEEKAAALSRERADLRAQLEENEEEMAEMLKKYKGAVQQVSEEQAAMAEQAGQLSALEAERATLKEQVAELWARLEAALEGGGRGDPGANLAQRRLALKARDLESRLELEQTTRSRMEVQITRLKEAAEKATAEANAARARELAAQEALRRAQWAAREAREEVATAAARESEAAAKKREAEQRATVAEAESATTRADLRLALARLGDLQAAMRGEMGSGSSGGEEDDTESDSDTSEDMVDALLSNHRRSSNIGLKSKGSSSHVSLESDYGSYGVADGSLGSTRSPAEGAPSKESSA